MSMHTEFRKIAIIHDWLNGFRGGERLLEALCELYPRAEIFTLFYKPGSVGTKIERHRIHCSFLNYLPSVNAYYRYLLPLFPLAIESFDLSSFDLIISSSHCVAKGVIPRPDALHICICHTPMRYAWDKRFAYFSGWRASLFHPLLNYLRIWDFSSSARVDYFVAHSKWVAERILKYYRRDAIIVPSFVDIHHFKPVQNVQKDHYLVVSAFAPYKKVELAILACQKLNRKLLVIGEGQEDGKLRNLALESSQFLGRVEEDKLPNYYSGARAVLFPGEEDFGLVPIEAMACGTPVIAYGRGGALDTVDDRTTGLFFPEETVDSICSAILEFERTEANFSVQACRTRAELFSKEKFMAGFSAFVEACLREKAGRTGLKVGSTLLDTRL